MRPDVAEASKALADELARGEDVAYVIDGALIDVSTGEILEGVTGDKLEWLVQRYQQAQANKKGWEQHEAILKQSMRALLAQAGQKSIATSYGTPTEMPARITVNVNAVKLLLDDAEIPADVQLAFYRAVTNGMNAKAAADALTRLDCTLEQIEAVLRVGEPYMQITPPRLAPPAIETRKVATR